MTSPTGADPLRDLLQARLGGQYEIESLLGQGGMGSVYRARDKTLDRLVAIKVIGGDVTTNAQLRGRFLLEARTVAKMRHPNLVAVYSAGDVDGLLYFVMELVPGESLRALLDREGTVEKHRAEHILYELAMALDYAHANGIVHRDVKPENILLDRETGRAMLTDFGVARALEGDGGITGTGMILGSPRYMSPEQASGESTLDGRSDLYSLALVGYEMYTGKPVVESSNVAGMLVKHLTETPRPLGEAVPDVPEGVATAIDHALAKDRARRWATGREMAEVIGMEWTPTGVNSGGGQRAAALAVAKALPARRARRIRVAAIAGAVVLAVAAVASLTSRRETVDPRRSYAVVPFDVQTGNPNAQWLRDGAVNMLTMALGQWRDLTVADYERTLVLVREEGYDDKRVDLNGARRIAEKAGAGTVVMGVVTTSPDSLHVQATLYDVKSGAALPNRTMLSAGIGSDPRPLFDSLARYLLDAAGGVPSASVELARATTTSLEAYRAYLDGVRLLNSWRLAEADSAFRVAIRADSTFALAWHKRALALGWGEAGSDQYLAATQRAVDLSDRLPAREQALVRGHGALARALHSQMQGDTGQRRGYAEAQRIFSDLVAQDPLVAEGWYGLGDAYFHDNMRQDDSMPAVQRRVGGSVRAFNRTLALDSTFHLAYSHLLQYYQAFSAPSNGFVMDGDSVRFVGSPEAVRAAGGAAAVAALRTRATARGLEVARGWVRADPDAPAPYLMLANMYLAAGEADSGVAVLDRAVARPTVNRPTVGLAAAMMQLVADDPRAYSTMRQVTTTATVAQFRDAPMNERHAALASAITIAGAVGNGAELQRTIGLFARVDSMFMYGPAKTQVALGWFGIGTRLALGESLDTANRRALLDGIRALDEIPGAAGNSVRTSSAVVPFVAYLATKDTTFSSAVRRWSAPTVRHTDLAALEALQRGDTAAARAIAAAYPSADSVRTSRLALAGLRTIARAEVLLALGDTSKSLAYLEALDPVRFTFSIVEPGMAAFGRTFAARARIYEDRGETDKAIAAWEEYLRRFEHGDQLVEAERAEGRAALRRLRETAR